MAERREGAWPIVNRVSLVAAATNTKGEEEVIQRLGMVGNRYKEMRQSRTRGWRHFGEEIRKGRGRWREKR